jgi:hypothetical protein
MVRAVSDLRLGVVGTPERYDRRKGLEKDRETSPACTVPYRPVPGEGLLDGEDMSHDKWVH